MTTDGLGGTNGVATPPASPPMWPYHDESEIAAVADVLRSGRTNYYTGPHGAAFEAEFAAYVGARHALAVTNGTTALELAIHALQLPAAAEIIVPCRTFVATASAVITNGLTPVFADIGDDLNVNVTTLEAARTDKTRAVIVVHYAGLPCGMREIAEWAYEHGIRIIEDCAHGHGARIEGRHVGTFGDVGCFSFCVGKIMSTGGEGGMVVTDNSVLHRRMAQRRDHGRFQIAGQKDDWRFHYTVDVAGTNQRMTEMQSAIGRIQLQKLDGWVARRRQIAGIYDRELDQDQLRPGHAFYMYMMRVQNWRRERVLTDCYDVGVRWGGCANITKEKAFSSYRGDCPNADKVGATIVSLPIYPTMTDVNVIDVMDAVRGAQS